jgi:hypothetical protein
MNEYEEVPAESFEEDFTVGDYVFIGVGCLAICCIFAYVLKQLKKTFKNVHLKVGDKIEIGIETKEDK